MNTNHPRHRRLRTGNYGGIKFDDGWFFFHVLETEYIELKPYVLKNEADERGPIAPETAGSEDDEIVDDLDRQLIEPDTDEKNLLFQVMMGVAPSRMQVFPIWGRDRSPNLEGGAEPGEPQVPVTGYDSPYNNPSDYFQFIQYNSQPDLQLQAYNPMGEEQEARVSFHVNKMKYLAVDDVNLMASFIQGQTPFKDFPTGMAAQRTDQFRVPNWMDDRFGDLIMSSSEILDEAGRETPEINEEGEMRDRLPGGN